MSNTVQKVNWFLKNLELQIEERRLRTERRSTKVLFDTADMRVALLGMEEFYTPNEGFDVSRFEKKAALVHALASAGWLGPIHMLPPHQNELLTQINLDFGTERLVGDPKRFTNQFLQALNINNELINSQKLLNLDHEERIEFVRKNAGSAEKLFKTIQFMRGSWRMRLVDWLDTGQLVLSEGDFDLAELMEGMTFQRLRRAFEFRGRRKRVNNFVDAIALADLSKKLRRFNAEKQESLPIIFSPDGIFERVAERAKIESRFRYTAGDHSAQLSVIRGPDYFIFKAIFDPPQEVVASVKGKFAFLASKEELVDLRDRVARILKARSNLEDALQMDSGLEGVSLSALIDQLRNLSFFENVWLHLSPKELEEIEEELQEAAEGLRGAEYQSAVDEALARATEEIEKRTETYKVLEGFWWRLGSATKKLNRRLDGDPILTRRSQRKVERETSQVSLDPFLHFGLLRFSFPSGSHNFIRRTLDALVSRNEATERAAKLRMVKKYRATRSGTGASNRALAELAGVLWCLELDTELVSLLEPLQPCNDPSLDLVLIAAFFRQNQKVGGGKLLIKSLRERYETSLPTKKWGQVMVGLAYLHFHLILCINLHNKDEVDEDAVQEQFNMAIDYARQASKVLNDLPQRIYALNCYLYYMIESKDEQYHKVPIKDEQYMEEMHEAAEELKKWIDKLGVWQYRFDDTLGRYYYLKARVTEDEGARSFAMDQAKEFITRAWNASLRDPEVLSFQSKFGDALVDKLRNQKAR